MSLQKQVKRGLFALPLAAVLIVAGVIAPVAATGTPSDDCATAQVETGSLRTVDFHSMLPGALHVVSPKVRVLRIREG
jgi:hypothetical protein